MAREAMDMCLRVLKERNKAMVVRNSILIVSHITFQDCHVHIFFLTAFLEIAVCSLNSCNSLVKSLQSLMV